MIMIHSAKKVINS